MNGAAMKNTTARTLKRTAVMTECTPASKKNTKNKKTAKGGLSLYRQNQSVYLVTLLSFIHSFSSW